MRSFFNGFVISVSCLMLVSVGCGGNPTNGSGGDGGSSTTSDSGGSGGQSTTTSDGGGGFGGCMVIDDGNDCTDEQCDGTSVPKQDGASCDNADSSCLSGVCRPMEKVGLEVVGCATGEDDVFAAGLEEDDDVVMTRLDFDENGSLEWLSFTLVINAGSCTAAERILFVTFPLQADVPASPGVYAQILVPTLLLEKGEDLGVFSDNVNFRRVRVHLQDPLAVSAGQHIFTGLDMHPSGCISGCYFYPGADANDPPVPVPSDEDFWCTNGANDNPPLSGCGAMNGPSPGINKPFKFLFSGGVALDVASP